MRMMSTFFISTLPLSCFVLCGCTTTPPPLPTSSGQKSNLTPGMVKSTIERGVTLQTQVLQAFGAPNIVTLDKAGHEVWTYDVQSVASSSATTSRSGSIGIGAGGIIGTTPTIGIAGASGSKSTSAGQVSSSTFTLMITFNENQVVEDYRMMSTQF